MYVRTARAIHINGTRITQGAEVLVTATRHGAFGPEARIRVGGVGRVWYPTSVLAIAVDELPAPKI